MKETIVANAELVFDPTRVARLSTRVSGSVEAILKITGERVHAPRLANAFALNGSSFKHSSKRRK